MRAKRKKGYIYLQTNFMEKQVFKYEMCVITCMKDDNIAHRQTNDFSTIKILMMMRNS